MSDTQAIHLLAINAEEPRLPGDSPSGRAASRRYLTAEEQDWLHESIARYRVLGSPVRSALMSAFEETWGRPLSQGAYNYHVTNRLMADRRAEALRRACADPEALMSDNVIRNLLMLDRIVELASQERLVGFCEVVETRDGCLVKRAQPIYERRLDIAVNAMDLKLRWIMASRAGFLPVFRNGRWIPADVRSPRASEP